MKKELHSRMVFPTSSRGTFPGFSAEDVGANTAAVKQDARDVLVVGEKFVRVALWFLKGGQFVEPDRQVKVHIVDRHGDSLVDALVGAGCRTQIAPGAVITISTPVDDPRSHLILFELWGRLRLYASVLPADAGASK